MEIPREMRVSTANIFKAGKCEVKPDFQGGGWRAQTKKLLYIFQNNAITMELRFFTHHLYRFTGYQVKTFMDPATGD